MCVDGTILISSGAGILDVINDQQWNSRAEDMCAIDS